MAFSKMKPNLKFIKEVKKTLSAMPISKQRSYLRGLLTVGSANPATEAELKKLHKETSTGA